MMSHDGTSLVTPGIYGQRVTPEVDKFHKHKLDSNSKPRGFQLRALQLTDGSLGYV